MGKDAKILRFQPKQKDLLSQEEIMNVFAGLVRLVYKSAEYSAYEKAKLKIDYYNQKLNETLIELNKRNKQVEELLELNENLISSLNQNREN